MHPMRRICAAGLRRGSAHALSLRRLHARAYSLGPYISETLQNGILESDDYYRNGLPPSKFQLATTLQQKVQGQPMSLQQIFEEHRATNPFDEVEADLRSVSESMREVIGTDHPVLERISSYFFDVKGKRVRPTIVLLMARAMFATQGDPASPEAISPKQKRLSEITEMIHTASLLHDDVIDEADTRRGARSINAVFGNKLAILGGDFLLARASLALSRLRNPDVIELMSMIIEHLVKGEVMQMKPSRGGDLFSNIDSYMTKSFYKTASLMANSCRSAAVLQGYDEEVQDIAFEYGKHAGLAFQVVDDLLDFVGTSQSLGKPSHNDLDCGIVTLPVLYAAEEFPELNDLIARQFKEVGDVEKAIGLVERSNSIERARQMAISCGENAVAAVYRLPPSTAQSALINLVERILNRSH